LARQAREEFLDCCVRSSLPPQVPSEQDLLREPEPHCGDPSYEPLLKKKTFQKVLFEVSVSKIDKPLDSGSFSNVLFIFDDILDVEIPVAPAMVQGDSKRRRRTPTTQKSKQGCNARKGTRSSRGGAQETSPTADQHQIDAMTMDKAVLTRLQKQKAEYIRSCIHDTVSNFLKNGRKHGISVVCTNHDLFSRAPVVQTINSESGLVVLFPYANVSTRSSWSSFARSSRSLQRKQEPLPKGLCELRTAVHQHNRPEVLLHSSLLRISVSLVLRTWNRIKIPITSQLHQCSR
jgi:hypothetical protein